MVKTFELMDLEEKPLEYKEEMVNMVETLDLKQMHSETVDLKLMHKHIKFDSPSIHDENDSFRSD